MKLTYDDINVESLPIRLYGIIRESIVDGPDLRFVVFVQGCPHHCKGCHNPESHDPEGGFLTTTDKIWKNFIKNPMITGITFSGGEPFLWAKELAAVGKAVRESGRDVMTYSGYTYEQLLSRAESDEGTRELLGVTNYLVDGRYEESLRDLTLKYRGSSNQRIWDITCYPNSKDAVKMNFDRKYGRQK